MNPHNRKQFFSKKMLGKALAFSIFVSLVSSANVYAASNDYVVQRIEQRDPQAHQGLYNGFKGYRHHRPGFQRHSDGWWYPEAAFKNIRPAPPVHARPPLSNHIDQPRPGPNRPLVQRPAPPRAALSDRHIRWCSQQYRSYRPSDNSFAVRRGERRSCISPFSR